MLCRKAGADFVDKIGLDLNKRGPNFKNQMEMGLVGLNHELSLLAQNILENINPSNLFIIIYYIFLLK